MVDCASIDESPEVLMLDEPSVGWRDDGGENIESDEISLHRGFRFLLVEQNAKLALEAAQRGYVL